MKNILRISTFLLIAVFFTSITGITVFTHYCLHDGEAFTTYLQPELSCESHIVEDEEDNHECCVKEEIDYEIQISDNCCLNQIDIYQIGTDLINHTSNFEFFIDVIDITPTIYNFNFVEVEEITPVSNSPPKTPITSERLSTLQRYLI